MRLVLYIRTVGYLKGSFRIEDKHGDGNWITYEEYEKSLAVLQSLYDNRFSGTFNLLGTTCGARRVHPPSKAHPNHIAIIFYSREHKIC